MILMIALRCVIFMNVRRTISFWKRGLPPRMKRLTNCSKTPPLGAILRSVFGWDYLMIGVQSKGYVNKVLDTLTPIAATSDYSSCRLNCADRGMDPSCLNA